MMCRFFFAAANRRALRSAVLLSWMKLGDEFRCRIFFLFKLDQGGRVFHGFREEKFFSEGRTCSQLGFWPLGKGARRQAGMPGSWVEQHYATFFMTIWFKQWFYKAIIAFMIFYDFELLVLNLLFYYFLKSVSCLFWADGKSLMQSEDSWAGVDDHRWESLGQIQLEDMLRWTL